MTQDLASLILSLTPENGSAVGNVTMLTALRKHLPDLSEGDYRATRDDMVRSGILERGRGRGGSIRRTGEQAETGDPAPAPGPASSKKKHGAPKQVLSYHHEQTRVNNPEVGMVHANTDPDGGKAVWDYDPHLDPILNFDSARGGIERLIDDAIGEEDPELMTDALLELKRLQIPYLNWTGKAERTNFEVDTVSLHVHERVDTATVLANVAKEFEGGGGADPTAGPVPAGV